MMNFGILCPSEIAYRRFLPALKSINEAHFVGVAVNTPTERYGYTLPNLDEVQSMLSRGRQKASSMVEEYGGRIFESYEEIIHDPSIDALYIPLPPALHYKWAKAALETGKHVLVEKPATISYNDTDDLVHTAEINNLALHENYMFVFHNQMEEIKAIIDSGDLGEIRLYRISFGFPRRAVTDFRYNKEMGGGALLDAGGYTLKCADWFLNGGDIAYANLNYLSDFNVDVYGSGAMVRRDGQTAQIAFGMDNEYKCELEVWGSQGSLTTGRILTAPAGFHPTAKIKRGALEKEIELPGDDAFRKSILHFMKCTVDDILRKHTYESIMRQASLVSEFQRKAEDHLW